MAAPYNNWYGVNPFRDLSRSMVDTTNFKTWAKTEAAYGKKFAQSVRGDMHIMARQHFPKSFASGGILAGVFAPTGKEAMLNPWRRRLSETSPGYIRNLEKLDKLHPGNPKIAKSLEQAKIGSGSFGIKGKLLSGGIGLGIVGASVLMTEGDGAAKAKAGVSAVASEIGFALGSLIGGPAGSIVGGIGLGMLADATMGTMDKIVDTERKKRKLSWGAHTAPFQTARAHTMRQQSLQLMNRGQMSARSLLGQEAVFVHK